MDKRAKIVCTIGPSSSNHDTLVKMIESGMNVARINFSHGEKELHSKNIETIRNSAKELNTFVGILGDLKGPKIRVGKFLNDKEYYKPNEEIDVYLDNIIGTHEKFSILQKELFDDVKVGDKLSIDDGKMIIEILKVDKGYMRVRTLNEGYISSNKGINAPGVILTMPFVSEKDYNDCLFAIKEKVNFIAASFVRRPQDVLDIRKILDDNGGKDIEIISKIENQEGVDNIEEIIKVSDGIMVARGDMGVEVPLELVPVYQKKIIRLCNHYGKPVITATHMLESMINCPRPTRAEAGDVANAILDGTDAVMLSGESAVGLYPVESVKTMSNIIVEIEKIVDYKKKYNTLSEYSNMNVNDAIGISVASCALSLNKAKYIFAFTETGGTAKRISHYRPCKGIIGVSPSERACERLSLYWGIKPILSREASNFLEHDDIAKEIASSLKMKKEDIIIMTSGFGVSHGQTNTIRLLTI